ncbi:MAG: hypothetical protein IJJ67_06740 [Oscillospiraceae bacterium]|nr:hypothetical protein [Oscillospiraceae bacterium]
MLKIGILGCGKIAMGIENTWQMWMHDPDGNPFEVMEYTPQSYQITGR